MRALPVVEGQLIVSVSQLKTWTMCPRKYELRYVRGLQPAFMPVALAFGIAFHSALGRYYSGIQSKGEAPALEIIEQTFRDSWQAQLDGQVPLQADEDDDLATVVDLGMKMLGVFHAHAAGSYPGGGHRACLRRRPLRYLTRARSSKRSSSASSTWSC